jgi:hypothetical protein
MSGGGAVKAALITVVGSIIVALIGVIGKWCANRKK